MYIVNIEFTRNYVFVLPGVLLKEELFITCHAKINWSWEQLMTNMSQFVLVSLTRKQDELAGYTLESSARFITI